MRSGHAATAVVFALATAYFLLFRLYGFQVEDEGTLLFLFDRVLRGERPYEHFQTVYTPGFFHGAAWLFDLCGRTNEGLRGGLALMNAATATGLFLLARRAAGVLPALIVPLFWVLMIPVVTGEFAAFNIPYPMWPAALATVVVAVGVLDWSREGGVGSLLLAGVAAGVAFSMKPNAGALAGAGAVWAACLCAHSHQTAEKNLARVASVLMLLGVWACSGFLFFTVEAPLLLLPAIGVTLLCGETGAGHFARDDHPELSLALGVLAAGFLAPVLLWFGPLAARVGVIDALGMVLPLQSGFATVYALGYPPMEPLSFILSMTAVAVAGAGWFVGEGRFRPFLSLAACLAMPLLALVVLFSFGDLVEGTARSLDLQLENASLWLSPLAACAGVAFLGRAIRNPAPGPADSALALVVPLAVAAGVQVVPRADFMHWIGAAPLLLVLASGLFSRAVLWWEDGDWPRQVEPRLWICGISALVCLLVAGVQLADSLHGPRLAMDEGAVSVRAGRVRAGLERAAVGDLTSFARTAVYLRENTNAQELALAFPALSGLLYAARLSNPLPYDYWFPGIPDEEGERKSVAQLRNNPPRLVVTLNRGWRFFTGAPVHYRSLRRFIRERYVLAARFGRFDVLRRSDISLAPVAAVVHPTEDMESTLLPIRAHRRAAVLQWLESVDADDAATATLPRGRAKARLLLRGLRDAGDVRGTPWMLAGLAPGSGRVRGEALSAIASTLEHFRADRCRWAGDFDLQRLGEVLAPVKPWLMLLQIDGAQEASSETGMGDQAGRDPDASNAKSAESGAADPVRPESAGADGNVGGISDAGASEAVRKEDVVAVFAREILDVLSGRVDLCATEPPGTGGGATDGGAP